MNTTFISFLREISTSPTQRRERDTFERNVISKNVSICCLGKGKLKNNARNTRNIYH